MPKKPHNQKGNSSSKVVRQEGSSGQEVDFDLFQDLETGHPNGLRHIYGAYHVARERPVLSSETIRLPSVELVEEHYRRAAEAEPEVAMDDVVTMIDSPIPSDRILALKVATWAITENTAEEATFVLLYGLEDGNESVRKTAVDLLVEARGTLEKTGGPQEAQWQIINLICSVETPQAPRPRPE